MDGWVSCTRSSHIWVTVMSWVTTLVGACHVLGHHKEGWLSCPGLWHGCVTTWLDTTWLGTTGHNMAGWLSCPRSPHGWVTVMSRVTTQMGDCHVLGQHMDRWLSYPRLCTHTQISSELNSVQTLQMSYWWDRSSCLWALVSLFFPIFWGVCFWHPHTHPCSANTPKNGKKERHQGASWVPALRCLKKTVK